MAIIGGGLAGLCLAIQGAKAGFSVVLFEKESYPFHKVCGEYISHESWPFLHGLGLPLQAWNLPQFHQLHVSDCSGKNYAFPLPLGGFGVSRYTLDKALCDLALSFGVSVFTGEKVENVYPGPEISVVESAARKIEARVVAGSFGKRSNLDIKWKRPFALLKSGPLQNFVGVKYHIHYPKGSEVIALYNFEDGYCGMSAVEENIYCLCYLTTAENLRKCGNDIARLEAEILAQNPLLAAVFKESTPIYKAPLTIAQVSFSAKSQVENHVLMLGDAAGMITPLCGNGMSMAMHGSKLAFMEIENFLSGKINRSQMEQNYARQWKKNFGMRLWVGRWVQKLFGGKRSTAAFLYLMHLLPPLARGLIKLTHGKPF